MVVYADVLIFLNTVVNYYVIFLVSKICKVNKKWYRYVFSAFLGALFSLYIFLPKQNFFVELIFRLICSAVIVLTAFGFENISKFAFRSVLLYLVTFLYAGIMLALWMLFKPNGMVVHNSVVYFNISPLFLIVISAIIYSFLIIIKRIFPPRNAPENCTIELVCDMNKVKTTATVDTGHLVSDLFSDSDIIFVSEKTAIKLFGETDPLFLDENIKRRYRAVPVKTVEGTAVLNGFRCDKAIITSENKSVESVSPIAVVSKNLNNSLNSAIVSPEILENARSVVL